MARLSLSQVICPSCRVYDTIDHRVWHCSQLEVEARRSLTTLVRRRFGEGDVIARPILALSHSGSSSDILSALARTLKGI